MQLPQTQSSLQYIHISVPEILLSNRPLAKVVIASSSDLPVQRLS